MVIVIEVCSGGLRRCKNRICWFPRCDVHHVRCRGVGEAGAVVDRPTVADLITLACHCCISRILEPQGQ